MVRRQSKKAEEKKMKEYWLDNPIKIKSKKNAKRRNAMRKTYKRKGNRIYAGRQHDYSRPVGKFGAKSRRRNRYRKNPIKVRDAIMDSLKSVAGFYSVGFLAPRLGPMLGPLVENNLFMAALKIGIAYIGGVLIESFNPDFGKQFATGGILNATTNLIEASGISLGSYNVDTDGNYIPGYGFRLPSPATIPSLAPVLGEDEDEETVISSFENVPDRLNVARLM